MQRGGAMITFASTFLTRAVAGNAGANLETVAFAFPGLWPRVCGQAAR